jgi:hypothetical protein
MKNCDTLLAYVDSPTFSKGLFFEVVISKILGKKSILILEGDLKSKFFKYFFKNIKKTNNVDGVQKEFIL